MDRARPSSRATPDALRAPPRRDPRCGGRLPPSRGSALLSTQTYTCMSLQHRVFSSTTPAAGCASCPRPSTSTFPQKAAYTLYLRACRPHRPHRWQTDPPLGRQPHLPALSTRDFNLPWPPELCLGLGLIRWNLVFFSFVHHCNKLCTSWSLRVLLHAGKNTRF